MFKFLDLFLVVFRNADRHPWSVVLFLERRQDNDTISLSLTPNDFDDTPETEYDDEAGEFSVPAFQEDFDDEASENDESIKEMEAGMRVPLAEWIVILPAKCPDCNRYFNKEDGGDGKGYPGQHFEPFRKFILVPSALWRQEHVGEVRYDAQRVD